MLKTLLHVGFFFGVDRYRTLRYNKHMSTPKHTTNSAEKYRNFSQIELEKDATKWVDCYLNCCYNSGLTTQRG
jgi:hypothetical protein